MSTGLYRPEDVRDSCGFGLIAEMSGKPSYELLRTAIESLTCMTHRGGIASDGKTSIGVYLRGVFKGFAGAAGVTAGLAIISDTATGAANELVVADVNSEAIVGMAYETATDTQSFKFLLNPFNVNLA